MRIDTRLRRPTGGASRLARLALPLLAVLAAAPAAAVPPMEDVLRGVGFTPAEIQQVRSGQLVKGVLESTSERELAVKIAFLVKASQEDLQKLFLASGDYDYDPSVTAFAAIRGEGSLDDFARLHLDPNGADMAQAYLNASPGIELNLSKQEIAAFNALKQGGGDPRERVEQQLRAMLLARHRAYLQKGLAGIPPYARAGGKTFEPGKGLRRKVEQNPSLKANAPELQQAVLAYPEHTLELNGEAFYWVNFRIDDKPTLSLVHRMDARLGEATVFAEIHHFVSRSHNSVVAMGGSFPVEGGSVVLYTNRTSTDQVAGFGSSTKRALGQRVMAGQIAQIFDRLQAAEAKK